MGTLTIRLRRHAAALLSLMVALVVTGPLLAPGFVLAYDMVFTPAPPLSRALIGLSRTLPRSVPTSLLVSLASRVVTGQVTQKLILLGIFAGAAYGAARLVPADRLPARVAAGVLYAWNPFVYERLLLGHWTLLLGYAVLPWVALAALDYRRGAPRSWARLTVALAAAMAAGPYAGLFAAGVAGALGLFPPGGSRRRGVFLMGGALVVNLPWLVPWLLHQPVPDLPALALELFRARSDSPLGVAGSLLSLGGLWRTDLAPPGRDGVAWIPAFILILGICALGWRRLGRRWPTGAARGLAVLGLLGLLIAAAPSLPLLNHVARWATRILPGGAILRDSQKFVIPLALLESVAFGAGVDRILGGFRLGDRAVWPAVLLLPILPIALAPTLAWGAGGHLSAASYPPSWDQAATVMGRDRVHGAVMVLPWHAYLPFTWNRGRTVRQPASLYFSRPVVADSSLQVAPFTLPAEDPWSRLASRAISSPAALEASLPRLGVRYVLLYKDADWQQALPKLEGLHVVLDTDDLALYRAPPPERIPTFAEPSALAVIGADVLTLALIVGAIITLLGVGWSRERPVILQPGDAVVRRGQE
jgi:hypothetical protein